MALLYLLKDGSWDIETSEVLGFECLEFWPYTTHVQEIILEAPLPQFEDIWAKLIKEFNEAGIAAYRDNKSVFVVKYASKTWYLGFKDVYFRFGLGIHADPWLKPLTKDTPKK